MTVLIQIETEPQKMILMDGQNVLKHNGGEINLENIQCLRKWSKENKVEVKIIFPKNNFYQRLF